MYPCYKAEITVIAHNSNCERSVILDDEGREKLKPYRLRHETEWRTRRVREDSDNSWKPLLIEACIEGFY